MCTARFLCYLQGGIPVGSRRGQPGARDPRPPAESRGLWIDGLVYFSGFSRAWGGAVALFDPGATGRAAARAHLVTPGQFSDVAAQEMGREPGTDLDLGAVVRSGRLAVGPGRYETVVCLGHLDGAPLLTFTSPWSAGDVEAARPSDAYLATMVTGLAEAHGMTAAQADAYLATLPGYRAEIR